MEKPQLPKCHFLGLSQSRAERDRITLPSNAAGDPFAFLPPAVELSTEELDLAARYENNDISGGYLRSQIAHFRKPKPKEQHEERRARLRNLQSLVDAEGLKLPDSFVKLVENDDYINRIRHNTIWLTLPEKLVPMPRTPQHQLANIFYEGQGCGFWHLLLAPDKSHVVVFSGDPLGLPGEYIGGFKPDLATYTFYQCAPTFDEWLVYYFLECIDHDKHYADMLEKYPGM
jgi:hypothetical protein